MKAHQHNKRCNKEHNMKRMVNHEEKMTLQVICNMMKQSEVYNEENKEQPCVLRFMGKETEKEYKDWFEKEQNKAA